MFNLLFPNVCGICKRICKYNLCPKCNRKLQELNQTKIESFNSKNFSEFAYAFKYEGIIRKRLIEYKFNEAGYLYKTFTELILKNKKMVDFIKNYDIIIPVPIHKKRKKQRGYNQSELIAKDICKKIELECGLDVIKKIKNTKAQSSLNGEDRKNNAKNVYELENVYKIINKKVLLLDDIYTTGNTANECCRVLKKVNPTKLGVLTIAKD